MDGRWTDDGRMTEGERAWCFFLFSRVCVRAARLTVKTSHACGVAPSRSQYVSFWIVSPFLDRFLLLTRQPPTPQSLLKNISRFDRFLGHSHRKLPRYPPRRIDRFFLFDRFLGQSFGWSATQKTHFLANHLHLPLPSPSPSRTTFRSYIRTTGIATTSDRPALILVTLHRPGGSLRGPKYGSHRLDLGLGILVAACNVTKTRAVVKVCSAGKRKSEGFS
jgi:hypothetical protein